jgi:hypothetical protein
MVRKLLNNQGGNINMKMIYMQPTIKVVEIKSQASLLAGSVKTTGLTNPLNYNDGVGNAEEEGM